MADKVRLELEPDEVRHIAVLRAIKGYNEPSLIDTQDTGVALALLKASTSNLEELESSLPAAELKLFLSGFITGLAATKVPQVSYEQQYDDTEFVGGRSGGVAIGQGTDERFVTQTGPQED